MQREYHAFIIMIGYCLPEAFSSPSNLYFFLHWPLWFLRLHSIWMQVQPLSQFLTRGKNRARWLLPLPRGLVEHWLCRSFSGRLGATCPFLLVPPTLEQHICIVRGPSDDVSFWGRKMWSQRRSRHRRTWVTSRTPFHLPQGLKTFSLFMCKWKVGSGNWDVSFQTKKTEQPVQLPCGE